jgi:Tfp pilus assembly protein PilF
MLLDITQQLDRETAEAIAETLGDLPLALAQAAAYIEAAALSLSDYLQRLQTHLEALLSRGEGSPDYPDTVATTWTMAFEALQETQPTATGLLKLCAFFAPDDIPHSLLRDHASALPEPLDHMVTDNLQWDDALKALRHYALIEAAKESHSIHRLVQAITRDRLPVEERAQWAEAAIQCVAALFPSGNAADDPRTWPIYARLFPHASSVISHVDEMDDAKVGSTLLLQMGFYLERRAQFAEARPYYERALAIREQVLGLQHPGTANSLNNLGYLLRAQGDLAGAKSYYERALAIREQVLGLQHPDTARSLNNLGGLLQAQSDLAGARPYLERALAICEQVLGPEHPDTATSLNNLGYLLQTQGDLAGAKPYYERALQIFRLRLGLDHAYTQTVLAKLEALDTDQ